MRRSGIFIAIGLLVLVNIIVLGGVAYNRAGEADATIVLTERELPLGSYYGYADRENTGLSLRLDWSRGRVWSCGAPLKWQRRAVRIDWFDKAKLEAIGFDCSVPPADPRAELHYQKLLPRKTFAVLEFEGASWNAWQAEEEDELARMEKNTTTGEVSQKQLKDARKEYERETLTHSRLFAVDVGNDPAALRRQYSDRARFVILPATVRLSYHRPDDERGGKSPAYLEGSVDDVLTDSIYVPKEHRALLEKFLHADRQMGNSDYSPYGQRQRGPAYAVTLTVGKRHEPWVTEVRPLEGTKTVSDTNVPGGGTSPAGAATTAP